MQFKRILLKLSGESLMGKKQYGIDDERLQQYAEQNQSNTDIEREINLAALSENQKGQDNGIARLKVIREVNGKRR